MNNLTANLNPLSLVNFKLLINSSEFSNTEFFAVTANIPSISLGEAPANYKNFPGYVPGEKLVYDPFNIRVMVDENLNVYKELFAWFKHNTLESNLKVADLTLMIMSSHNNPNVAFRFVNAFPTNLGALEFNVQQQDIEYAATDVTFRYDYFTITNAGGDPIICD